MTGRRYSGCYVAHAIQQAWSIRLDTCISDCRTGTVAFKEREIVFDRERLWANASICWSFVTNQRIMSICISSSTRHCSPLAFPRHDSRLCVQSRKTIVHISSLHLAIFKAQKTQRIAVMVGIIQPRRCLSHALWCEDRCDNIGLVHRSLPVGWNDHLSSRITSSSDGLEA